MNTEKHEAAMCDLEQIRAAFSIIVLRQYPESIEDICGEMPERTRAYHFATWGALEVIQRSLEACDKAIEEGFQEMWTCWRASRDPAHSPLPRGPWDEALAKYQHYRALVDKADGMAEAQLLALSEQYDAARDELIALPAPDRAAFGIRRQLMIDAEGQNCGGIPLNHIDALIEDARRLG